MVTTGLLGVSPCATMDTEGQMKSTTIQHKKNASLQVANRAVSSQDGIAGGQE